MCGHLRSVLRAFSSSSTPCVWALIALASELFPPTGCVWTGRCCAGTTHVLRPCFQGLLVDVCTLSLVSCFVTPPCRRCTLADQANLLVAVSRRLLTPAAVAAFADQAPRGQRVPLDQFRLLMIDRSAESVESFLSSRSRIWHRLESTSRQLTLLTHLKTHLEALLVVTHCESVSNFTLRFVSFRRYSLSTHLDLRVEVCFSPSILTVDSSRSSRRGYHAVLTRSSSARTADSSRASSRGCRSSFFVDSSRLVFCHSLHAALLLLTLTLFSSLLDLVELAAPPGLWFAIFWNCCT